MEDELPEVAEESLIEAEEKTENNYAFIDGQNLYYSTAKRRIDPWRIDLKRFRKYLSRKYSVAEAYYFLGYKDQAYKSLYKQLRVAGYILIFREHSKLLKGNKKGNIDADLIFEVMKRLYLKESFDNVVLVSGDGDYVRLVDFLILEDRLKMLLFPDSNSISSLYSHLPLSNFTYLDAKDTKDKIQVKDL